MSIRCTSKAMPSSGSVFVLGATLAALSHWPTQTVHGFPRSFHIALFPRKHKKNDSFRNNRSLRFISDNDDSIANPPTSKVSIAVVGTGAVGSYYGARLWERHDLYDVKFHMRSAEHYEACKKNGLHVKSVDGDIFIPPSALQAYRTTHEMDKADWVVLALKSTALESAPSLLQPLLHTNTRVLAIMNGLIDDDLVDLLRTIPAPDNNQSTRDNTLPCAAVYGGMAFICSNRLEPGLIEHSHYGMLTGAIAASLTGADDESHLNALVDLWKPTTVKFSGESSLIRGRWVKNCWNLPFNSISCAMGGILTVDEIVRDPGLRKLANDIMDETIVIANADLASRGMDSSTFLGNAEKKWLWDVTDTMGPYKPSTMLDLIHRRPMEVKYLFRRPLEIANKLNVTAPKLEAVVEQIEALQRHFGLY